VVIGDGGRRDATLLVAHGAHRGSRKLVLGPPPPGLERVPGPPRQRLGGSEIASVHVVEGALDPQPRQENGARASLSRAYSGQTFVRSGDAVPGGLVFAYNRGAGAIC
jgi:hypothetical protein